MKIGKESNRVWKHELTKDLHWRNLGSKDKDGTGNQKDILWVRWCHVSLMETEQPRIGNDMHDDGWFGFYRTSMSMKNIHVYVVDFGRAKWEVGGVYNRSMLTVKCWEWRRLKEQSRFESSLHGGKAEMYTGHAIRIKGKKSKLISNIVHQSWKDA